MKISNFKLRESNRVNDASMLSSTEELEYKEKGDAAYITPLVFAAPGSKYFKTFSECHEQAMKPLFPKYKDQNNALWKWPIIFYEEGRVEYLKWMEAEYKDCAGVCKTPLFSISKTIENGPVAEDCSV